MLLDTSDFFDLAYADIEGHVYISFHGVESGQWFKWPKQRDALLRTVENNKHQDVYFSVSSFDQQLRRKEHAGMASVIYVDADEWDLSNARVEPSVVVRSSPGHYQAFWFLTSPISAEDAATLSHKISVAHKEDGCDQSSWIMTKVMRVPGTTHAKDVDNTHPVEVIQFEGAVYTQGDLLEAYGDVQVNQYHVENKDLPTDLPSRIELQSQMDPVRLSMFMDEPEQGTDMSAYMWSTEQNLFEWGYTAPEVFVLMSDPTHNKYHPSRVGEVTASGAVRPPRSDHRGALWVEVQRAEAAYIGEVPEEVLNEEPEEQEEETAFKFLTPEEEQEVLDNPTFADEYTAWATSRTDAPAIYHRNLALSLLSCVYGNKARIHLRHGFEPLNLWLILLGDTTVSRKTTSVRLMEEVLNIYEDFTGTKVDIGADFSPEALTKKLGERDGLVSMINRDEVQGFFKTILGKTYMSDALDVLTNLYGGRVKQVLRTNKETAQEKRAATVFNLLLYGIAEQTAEQLNETNFQSGFLQRFTWVVSPPIPLTPERLANEQGSLDDLTDQGQDTWAQNTALALMARLEKMDYAYQRIMFEPDAFARVGQWKNQVIFESMADEEERKSYTPTIQRMEMHIFRAAALLAMHDGHEMVSMPYVLAAIKIAEDWYDGFQQMRRQIVGSDFAARTREVLLFIKSKGSKTVPKSHIYRRFSNHPPRIVGEWIEALKMRDEIYDNGNKVAVKGNKQE